jgi:ribosomal-protein-alanine N-acetyltransferase
MIGYLIVSRYADDWHIMNLAVDPAWRQRGVARQLLENFLARTAGGYERGYTLEVRVSNDEAIRLYERLGFEARGVRRGYYLDNHEDAVIMWKDA